MTTVFIGGSRHISRLPVSVQERLSAIVEKGHAVFVGDANGADKATQKFLADAGYTLVTVFCSGPAPRNNLAGWPIRSILPPKGVKGFHFYAAKDREMAREADFGLMIWDGKSPGTLLNVLRLAIANKICVLVDAAQKKTHTVKTLDQLRGILNGCDPSIVTDFETRATSDELALLRADDISERSGETIELQPALPLLARATPEAETIPSEPGVGADIDKMLNEALITTDPRKVVDLLGAIARGVGMSEVARRTGLSRESLYRSLGNDGNPEFATVLKVIAALDIRFEAHRIPHLS
jgi:probable addiction module antidote protein